MNQPLQGKDAHPPINGAALEFAQDAVIFREGDPGGDLFFVKEGEIEVFRSVNGRDVRLALLGPGEVLGTMTCLTGEARLASARALSPVKALVVKQGGFKSLISSTPQWVRTVIKDFTVRVKAMDELYTGSLQRIEMLELEASPIRLAMCVAKGLGEIGALIAVPVGEQRAVDVDRALQSLAPILDVSPEATQAIFKVFIEAGLLRADPNAAVRRADLAVLERLGGFADVARRYLASPEERVKIEALFGKEVAYLQSVAELVKGLKLPVATPAQIPMSRFAVPEYSAEFVRECFKKAEVAHLLRMVEQGYEAELHFVPGTLMLAIHSIVAIAKLRGAAADRGARLGVAPAIA